MRRSFLLVGVGVVALGTSCDNSERIARLEKQNQELQAQIASERAAAADYDLQEKCARQAKTWFSENWGQQKNTLLLNYTNHYSKSKNKCFILVEYHYALTSASLSWTNHITIWDVNENADYGGITVSHFVPTNPNLEPREKVIHCQIGANTCSSRDEFDKLANVFMID